MRVVDWNLNVGLGVFSCFLMISAEFLEVFVLFVNIL